jgi:hypothetical protein
MKQVIAEQIKTLRSAFSSIVKRALSGHLTLLVGFRPAGSNANGGCADRADLGFFPFADAALLCTSSALLAVMQHSSPKRSLPIADMAVVKRREHT